MPRRSLRNLVSEVLVDNLMRKSTRLWIVSATTLAVIVVGIPPGLRRAKLRAESTGCGNYMVSIALAARMWANDHDDRLPPNLLTMSNELNSPKVLHCPGDGTRQRFTNWAEFTDEKSSYEIASAGVPEGDTNTVFLRCNKHGHIAYSDATVFDGRRRRTKEIF